MKKLDWFSEEGREEIRRLLSQSAVKKTRHIGDILAGRPYLVANIPTESWEFEELKIKYHEILNKLTYKEAMALCRAFDYSYSTFLMRKYGHRHPRFEEVILTVNWYRNGKPVVAKKHRIVASLFLK